MQFSLNNKVALVVGAADEVGSAIAKRLASQGATVVLLDKDASGLAALAAEITKTGGKALAITADPVLPQTAKACVEQVRQSLGDIHVLVNNTPDPAPHGLGALSAESFAGAIASTVGVQFAFMREVVPMMRDKACGRVVNLASIRYLGLPGGTDLAAAQSSTFGLTRSVALEAAPQRVTVNTVVKGDLARPGMSEEETAKAVGPIPAKRLGTVDDIAYAVGFFASDAAQYVTGQTFFVCGGRSAHFSMSV